MSTGGSSARSIPIRMVTIATLALLLTQFVVGMVVNVYVGIPSSHPGTSEAAVPGAMAGIAWAITRGTMPLALHAGLGVLLAAGALLLLALAVRSRDRAWIAAAVAGGLGVAIAGVGGVGFLNTGEDTATLVMSVGFAMATGSYVFGLFAGGNALAGRRTASD